MKKHINFQIDGTIIINIFVHKKYLKYFFEN
jgi:hypothetical protein